MKNKKGKTELSYNPQLTVDKKGFILANDVCNDTHDINQLQPQVLQTKENIGSLSENIPWNFDYGYFSGENIAFLDCKKIDGYIPDHELAVAMKGKKAKQNYIDTLTYNKESDTFITPEGESFTFVSEYTETKRKKKVVRRKYVLKRNNNVVKIIKPHKHVLERYDMYKKMRTLEGREIYKNRFQTVEPVIGDIKENKGVINFLTRSLETVKTEFNLVCAAHNIKRVYNESKKDIQVIVRYFLLEFCYTA